MENNNDFIKQAMAKAVRANPQKVSAIFAALAEAGEAEDAIIEIYAALQPDARKEFIEYWKGLYGKEYSTDMAKDYVNTGKKKKNTDSLDVSEKIKKEALSSSNSDANEPVKKFWSSLLGSEYSTDMTKYPTANYKTVEVVAGMSDGLKQLLANASPDVASELLNMIGVSKKN